MVPPQPLDAVPQFCPAGQLVRGWHTQTLFSQELGDWQLPHGNVPPQPSGMDPQLLPSAAHVVLSQQV
jgi:hypothetical protein